MLLTKAKNPSKPWEQKSWEPKPVVDYLRQEIVHLSMSTEDAAFPQRREEYPEVDYEELATKTATFHTRAKHAAPYVKAYNSLPSDSELLKQTVTWIEEKMGLLNEFPTP